MNYWRLFDAKSGADLGFCADSGAFVYDAGFRARFGYSGPPGLPVHGYRVLYAPSVGFALTLSATTIYPAGFVNGVPVQAPGFYGPFATVNPKPEANFKPLLVRAAPPDPVPTAPNLPAITPNLVNGLYADLYYSQSFTFLDIATLRPMTYYWVSGVVFFTGLGSAWGDGDAWFASTGVLKVPSSDPKKSYYALNPLALGPAALMRGLPGFPIAQNPATTWPAASAPAAG